jgi:two-component system sensor histidine kinase BarA
VPFDPAALVEKIVSVMSVRALKKGLGFDVRLDPKLPAELIGDPGRIRQVIVNLAGNSLKFTEQGSVSLGISVLEDLGQRVKLRFEVVDTGIGIPGRNKRRFLSGSSRPTATLPYATAAPAWA